MTTLRIFSESRELKVETHDAGEIIRQLSHHGIRFERWTAERKVLPTDGPPEVLSTYAADVKRLFFERGFATADVIHMQPDNPNRAEVRKKFLDEHTHSEDEARFFVRGSGLFNIHVDGVVLAVLCTQGDLLSIPAGTPHWFDMGPAPSFTCIRFFTDQSGWVAKYTGNTIANAFPRLDAA